VVSVVQVVSGVNEWWVSSYYGFLFVICSVAPSTGDKWNFMLCKPQLPPAFTGTQTEQQINNFSVCVHFQIEQRQNKQQQTMKHKGHCGETF